MNITVKQIEFKSTDGVTGLFGWLYIPSEPCVGTVQIVHGMAEHMGRYHEFMRELARDGYAACGIDQLGHGRSADAGMLGFFAEQDGWRLLIEDQYKFNRIVRSEISSGNVAMLGHSMGSMIARLYAAKYAQSINALLLSGTARSGFRVETAIRLSNRSIKKFGSSYPDAGLDKLVFSGYNDLFEPAKTKFDWLSRDRELVRIYTNDVRCGFLFTASAFRDLFILTHKANSKKCFENTPDTLPVLLFSGALDPVGESGKGPSQVYARYVKAGLSDVELVLYEGGRHEMLNENNRAQVYRELMDWLDRHVVKSPQDEKND